MTDREQNQATGAETAGFHARSVIDDALKVLMHVRNRLDVDVPEGLAGTLDDIGEMAESALGMVEEYPLVGNYWGDPVDWPEGSCSCGMLGVIGVESLPCIRRPG